jgi:hypothetical protein
MDKAKIIEEFFEGTSFLVRGKQYPAPLPPELANWYFLLTLGKIGDFIAAKLNYNSETGLIVNSADDEF